MPTIQDVAKIAGVSVTTVSRVLNNHPYVSKEKVKAVNEAIEETGYIQNINAINLKRGKTNLVGVVIPYLDHPYFAQLLHGISQAASMNQYKIVLYQTEYDEAQELEALEMLKLKQIDNLIICSRKISLSVIERYKKYGEIVLFENAEGSSLNYTYVDHYYCFLTALNYLYDNGHREIGFTLNRLSGMNSQQREQAYKDFLMAKGLSFNEQYIFHQCLYLEDGKRVLDELLSLDKRPTALLVTSDEVATGVILASGDYEIDIPKDLAIIGFDNQPIAQAMNLTTMDVPLYSIGQILFEQTIEPETTHHQIQVELVERATV